MIARLLVPLPDQAKSRYPVRQVVEEREVADWQIAIEEIKPLANSYLVVEAEDRTFHFFSEIDTWKHRSTAIVKEAQSA